MSVTTDLKIMHIVDGDNHDFNLYGVPYEVLLPLSNALRLELNTRSAALSAPDFRQQRALQHQRHLEHCRKTGETPKQQFIDFPLH